MSAAVVVKKGVDGVTEQVRGMKVRASVKKLCEGCKVRLALVSFGGRGFVGWDRMGKGRGRRVGSRCFGLECSEGGKIC